MFRGRSTAVVGLATALVITISAPPVAADDVRDRQPLLTTAGLAPIANSWSVLERDDDEIEVSMRAMLKSSTAYTIWWVVFNRPEKCTQPCDENDIFVDGMRSKGLNTAQIAAVGINVFFADGAVSRVTGMVRFNAELEEGEMPTGAGTVLIGQTMSGVAGMADAQKALVHVVVRDHGAPSADAGVLHSQLTTGRGGCPPGPCTDDSFAEHLPLVGDDDEADDDD
jgi:hypothetical protein